MAPKRGLGKGLSALLSGERDEEPETESIPGELDLYHALDAKAKQGEFFAPIEKLIPNPNQPRKIFGEEELAELAESIKHQGIIQPIIAEDAGDGTYTIIAGERRTRAARIAGFEKVPVVIRNYSGEKQMEISLTENIQRSNLNPIEEAFAYRQLMEANKLSQEDVAARVGKNRATVANAMRLLKLPGEMQKSVQKGDLTPGHARALLSIAGADAQEDLFHEIIEKGLSVREAEKRATAIGNGGEKTPPQEKNRLVDVKTIEIRTIEEKFIAVLGTKVAIKGDLNKGSIVIDYFSAEDLDRLYDILS